MTIAPSVTRARKGEFRLTHSEGMVHWNPKGMAAGMLSMAKTKILWWLVQRWYQKESLPEAVTPEACFKWPLLISWYTLQFHSFPKPHHKMLGRCGNTSFHRTFPTDVTTTCFYQCAVLSSLFWPHSRAWFYQTSLACSLCTGLIAIFVVCFWRVAE